MPYIKKIIRFEIDGEIDDLAFAIQEQGKEGRAGNLNYAITKLIDSLYDLRYSEINEAIGALECVKQEFYRRVAGPYEDLKAVENGDVYKMVKAPSAQPTVVISDDVRSGLADIGIDVDVAVAKGIEQYLNDAK